VGLPHVRVGTIERLLEAYRRTRAPAVVPRFAARRGAPVIWDQALFGELAGALATGAVLDGHASEVVSVSVDDPAVIDELETPEDYERLVRQINRDLY
jgi:molybdenum cofactor cytidylyltransferase